MLCSSSTVLSSSYPPRKKLALIKFATAADYGRGDGGGSDGECEADCVRQAIFSDTGEGKSIHAKLWHEDSA